MFEGLVCHFEHIFVLFNIPKCDVVEVEKAMYQGLAWHFQLIFGFWINPKYDLGEVKRRFFLWLQGTATSISTS